MPPSDKPAAPWGSARQALLEAGRELLIERFLAGPGDVVASDVLGFLTPTTIAQRAGVARGVFYHHWGVGAEDDLTPFDRYVSELWPALWGGPTGFDLEAVVRDHPGPIEQFILDACEIELHRYDEPAEWARYKAGIAMGIFGIGVGVDGVTQMVLDELTLLYGFVLERFSRRIRPPWTIRDLAVAVFAAFEGSFMARAWGVEEIDQLVAADGAETCAPQSITATLVLGVVDRMTGPAGEPA